MTAPLPALRAAVQALLDARGESDLSAVVARADLELAGPDERWSMGSREVLASRVALIVDAPAFAALSANARQLAAVKDAFASAARTPETELAGLSLVLRLPGIERGWHHVYRDAPRSLAALEPADPEAILGGAAALLDALGDAPGAAMLRRARLETAPVPGAGRAPLRRCVARLDPADLAKLDHDVERAERLRRAVRDAGTSAAEAVASVDFATALRPLELVDTPEARLASALQARGAASVTISRSEEKVVLAVISWGDLRLVELTAAPSGELDWRVAEVRTATVSADQLASAELAHAVAALICDGG